jgi:hypothetical protein
MTWSRLVSLTAFAAASFASSSPALAAPGLYALSQGSSGLWLLRVFENGTHVHVGTDPVCSSALVATQSLTAVDAPRALLYTILADTKTTANTPMLAAISLANGSLASPPIALPISNGEVIGVGQLLTVLANGTVLFTGVNEAGTAEMLFSIDPVSGKSSVLFVLNGSAYDVSVASAKMAYAPATNEVFFGVDGAAAPYERIILAVDISTGKATEFPNPKAHRLWTYDFDPVSGGIIGVGSEGAPNDDDSETTIIAQLSPTNRTITPLGTISEYVYTIDGVVALNTTGREFYLAMDVNGSDPFNLIGVSLDGALRTTGRLCSSDIESCPLSLDFYDGTGVE